MPYMQVLCKPLYLEKADYSIRETLVLKIAILSEKYAHDYTWYVDTILNLIRLAGDYVSEEVWYRIVQVVINTQEVQGYAAEACFEALQAPACHENMIKVGGYILGEFGNLIAGDPRSSPLVQFQLLHSKFHLCSVPTRALILSTYVKFINLFPEIKPQIQQILSSDSQSRNGNQELQQRAIEYLQLTTIATPDVLATVLEEMPTFPERESTLLSKLYQSAPWTAKLHKTSGEETVGGATREEGSPAPVINDIGQPVGDTLVTTSSPEAAAPGPSDQGLLIDVFGGPPPAPAPSAAAGVTTPPTAVGLSPGAEEGFMRFLLKNNGVLFENEMLQIGVKSEYKKNLGRIGVFFGNKSSTSLKNFSSNVSLAGSLEESLNIQAKPIDSTIENGAQVQQVINVECKAPFFEAPLLNVQFSVGGNPHQLVLKLPVFINKFIEETVMGSADFFSRWKQLANQEVQKIFAAKHSMENEFAASKLRGYGVSMITGVDPNGDNFVSAGIINTRTTLIGCLLRLEPNKETKMYRITVRTSNEAVSRKICDILSEQF